MSSPQQILEASAQFIRDVGQSYVQKDKSRSSSWMERREEVDGFLIQDPGSFAQLDLEEYAN